MTDYLCDSSVFQNEDPRLEAVRRVGSFSRGLSKVFELGVRARLALYAQGLFPTSGATSARVVSVGNLRVGGSGKTPLCLWLCRMATENGLRCGLCLRGYRGRFNSGAVLVSESASVEDVGDEAALALRRLQGMGVVVAVGRDRVRAVQQVEHRGAQFIVLDDGFSHLRLRRDVNLVLVCPEDLAPNTRLLPTGPLREPPASLSRAHLVAGLAQDWAGVPGAPQILFDVRPVSLLDRHWKCLDLVALAGRKVLLASGIARPKRFAQTAQRAGMVPVGHWAFPDHRSPDPAQAKKLVEQARQLDAEAIVWTEKDWVRLPTIDFPCLALRIEVSPIKGLDLLMQEVLRSYSS